MQFKLDLNESLFDDDISWSNNDVTESSGTIATEGEFDKYALDDDFCELDYELSDSEATVLKAGGTSAVPAGPQPGADTGVADLLIAAINDEWEAIRTYNSLATTLAAEASKNPQFAAMINVINDINAEENKHVGQLQEILKAVSPNANMIEKGETEGQMQFKFVNGKLPVQSARIISEERGEIPANIDIDTTCTINDIDDEW